MRTKEKRPASSAPKLPQLPKRLEKAVLLRLLIRFALSALFSQAVVLGNCAPLALGFVGASGSGAEGFAALCGALCGYLLGMGFTGALRYAAASILIYSIAFAFFDLPAYKKPWFMAVCSASAGAITGFAYLSGAGWEKSQIIAYLSEVMLIGLSCLLFQELDQEKPGKGGLLLLAAGAVASLAQLDLISAGTLAALMTVICTRAGSGTGAVAGAALGMAVGLTSLGTPLLSATLAFAGALAGGASTRQNRLLAGGIFLAAGLLGALWVQGGMQMALQITVGSLLYICIPEKLLRQGERLIVSGEANPLMPLRRETSASTRRVQARLETQAAAFRSLHDRIQKGLVRNLAPEPPTSVFECTAKRVCAKCHMHPVCWQREYPETRDSLNAALAAMLDHGQVQPEDLGAKFHARCPNLDQFVKVSNEELHEYWNRMRYASRIRTSRLAVCRQYMQLSHLLDGAAAELGDVQRTDPAAAASVERGLERLGFTVQAEVRLDHRRRKTLELRGKNLTGLNSEEGSAAVSRALGAKLEPMGVSRVRQGQRLIFQEAPPLMATVAAVAVQKDGQTTSGDTGTWFRDENGCLWVVLCDGMGSGEAAAGDSRLLMNLLEEFLHAGVDPTAALTTITAALSLRGEVNGGFTTVDLLSIDLFSGSTELFKLGGAPTYLRRKGLVSRVTGSALPAGLELDRESLPDCSRFRLDAGDFAVLVSDGVTDGESDEILRQALASFHGESPRELARTLLGFGSGSDDRTVIAVRLSQRG